VTKTKKPSKEKVPRKAVKAHKARAEAPAPTRRGRGGGATDAEFKRRRDPHAEREAQRYERPIPSREAILALLEERGELLTEARIAEALALDDEYGIAALTKRLGAMVRDGQLLLGRRGGYAPVRKLDLIPGVVLANAEGYGFLRPDEGGDDLYLSPYQMRSVLHGDRVLASVVGLDRRGRRQGSIVEVLQRRSPRLVGPGDDRKRRHPGCAGRSPPAPGRDDRARTGTRRAIGSDRGGRDHRSAYRLSRSVGHDPQRAG